MSTATESCTLWCFKQGQDAERAPSADGEAGQLDAERPLRCKLCEQIITSPSASLEVDGARQHTFFNPAGLMFEIGCFSAAPGCVVAGEPSDQFSWFPGYAWRYAHCAGCGAHLGWCFESGSGGRFFGLVLNRLA